MSLADYTALKAAVATDWLHRTDLTSQSADFIALFESDFNASMRTRQMEQSTSIASTAGYLMHPTSWLGWKEIRGNVGSVPYELDPTSDEVAVARTRGDSGVSRIYKVTGTKTFLYPSTGGTFATKYYEGVALTSGTNWLLTAYPGAYLFGSLIKGAMFLENTPNALPMWQQAYAEVVEKIKADSRRAEWSGQALRMAPDSRVV